MAFTLNTNAGALQALSTIRENQVLKDKTSKNIQTGYRVADAFDDASTFAVAQGVRSGFKQQAAIQGSLAAGEGIGQVASAALKSISNLVSDIKAKIIQLSDGSLSSSQVNTYSNDLFKQLSQVSNYISQATYQGRNIFTNPSNVSFLSDISGSTLVLSSQSAGVSAGFNTFSAAAVVFTAGVFSNPGSASILSTMQAASNAYENNLNLAIGNVAAETRGLQLQKNFIDELIDATKKGLGAVVDSDVAAESATLQSMQVREQLGFQSLSIANQEPQTLLSLFR